MRLLEKLARLCAVLAGVLLTVITLITCVSLLGRNTIGWTIVGAFELTGSAAGAAIALFKISSKSIAPCPVSRIGCQSFLEGK